MSHARSFVVIALLSATSLAAAAINPNAPASAWSGASSSERLAYATQVEGVCPGSNSKCSSAAIKACLDEALKSPLPAAARSMTIGEAAVTCVVLLK
jgi:hypothetical protein